MKETHEKLHSEAHKLLAYAGNTLDADERAEVEELIANDEEAFELLAQFKITDLPYKDAFAVLLDDADTADLEEIIDRKKSAIREPQFSTQEKSSKWLWPTSLVASLLLGATLTFFSLNATQENHDNWIVQVADYHLLYIRDTVSHSHSTSEEIEKLTRDLGAQLNAKLTIPNLNKQKLDFRRGQILDSNGRKLVQLAYLPQKGRPVALCIIKDESADSLPMAGESRGLPYVTWSKKGLSYVIIGDIDKNDLNAAALSALAQIESNG